MKTKSFAKHEIDRSWFVVDADDQVLGRMASEIAKILRGKHKPTLLRTPIPVTSLLL